VVWGTIFPKPPITLFDVVVGGIRAIICGNAGQYVLESVSKPGATRFFAVGCAVRHEVLPPTA
jgi:hypothetical protein